MLTALLNDYCPSYEEIAIKERMLAFIDQYDDCFERSLAIGHITGSAWLLNKDHNKVLLMHHAKHDSWFQLGGHCDGNHDVLSVAIREAQEESGILHIAPVVPSIFDIDIHLIPANQKEAEHLHYDVRFLLHVTSDEKEVQNKESKELRWVGKERHELPVNQRSVVRMFDKWLALK